MHDDNNHPYKYQLFYYLSLTRAECGKNSFSETSDNPYGTIATLLDSSWELSY